MYFSSSQEHWSRRATVRIAQVSAHGCSKEFHAFGAKKYRHISYIKHPLSKRLLISLPVPRFLILWTSESRNSHALPDRISSSTEWPDVATRGTWCDIKYVDGHAKLLVVRCCVTLARVRVCEICRQKRTRASPLKPSASFKKFADTVALKRPDDFYDSSAKAAVTSQRSQTLFYLFAAEIAPQISYVTRRTRRKIRRQRATQ